MADPFIGQIIMFAGNFAPRSWALCDGQLLAIASNQSLFSILGTTYGGDGRTTFGLPDLRGRAAMHQGKGPGLADRRLGEKGGAETVTLTEAQMPSHTHTPRAQSGTANSQSPDGNVPAREAGGVTAVYSDQAPDADMNPQGNASAGGGQLHDNIQPFQCVNYIIALEGLYPSRN